mmetsp:Transcript_102182/g.289371  ORF Transcript_102182/g.289371 Transcript_102182/m.289371 type:complete len:153 (+) Transcript_102182:965-1423(+)
MPGVQPRLQTAQFACFAKQVMPGSLQHLVSKQSSSSLEHVGTGAAGSGTGADVSVGLFAATSQLHGVWNSLGSSPCTPTSQDFLQAAKYLFFTKHRSPGLLQHLLSRHESPVAAHASATLQLHRVREPLGSEASTCPGAQLLRQPYQPGFFS